MYHAVVYACVCVCQDGGDGRTCAGRRQSRNHSTTQRRRAQVWKGEAQGRRWEQVLKCGFPSECACTFGFAYEFECADEYCHGKELG